eukprot:1201192-Amphidinium_carterae.1
MPAQSSELKFKLGRTLDVNWDYLGDIPLHQRQGAVEQFHQTLFAQVRSIKCDIVDNLKTVDDIPETIFPW